MKKICLIVSGLANGGVESFIKTFYSNSMFKKYDKVIITHNEPDEKVKESFRQIDFRIISVPSKKNNFFKNYFMIKKILKKEKFDIVHSNMAKSNFIYLFIAKLSGVKIRIAHSHISIESKSILKKILYSTMRYLNRNTATTCLACSNDALLFAFGKKVFKKNNEIIHNAINLEKFSFNEKNRILIRNELRLKSNEVVIGNIARFTYQKNQEFLIDLIKELRNYGDYKLVLIGEGELKPLILNKIKELYLEKSVLILDPTPEVYKYYSAFDVFCLPSRFEGLGIVGIEAQANGLFTIVSNKLPLELKQTNHIKYIGIDNKNIKEWTSSILEVKGRYKDKKLIKSSYNINNEVNKLIKIYEQRGELNGE